MIRPYWILLFLTVVSISVVVTHYQVNTQVEARVALLVGADEARLGIAAEQISGFLRGPAMLLESLRNESPIIEALDDPQHRIAQLEQALRAIASRDRSFRQVRWIDEHGVERVRIQRAGDTITTVPRGRLQDKSQRYYFTDSVGLASDEIYYSPLDLNVEYGKVDRPLLPMIRVAVSAQDSEGRRRGIFIINREASEVLDIINLPSSQGQTLLANEDGFWLRGFHPSEDWGFMFGHDDRVEKYSSAAWSAVGDRKRGHVLLGDGMWTWATVDVADMKWFSSGMFPSSGPKLKLIAHHSAAMLDGVYKEVWRETIAVTAPLAAAFWLVLVALLHAREKQQKAANQLIESERMLEVKTKISAAREQAAKLIESNVNGMLLVDESGVIVMTNPALNELFGYQAGELIGEPMEILVPAEYVNRHRRLRIGYGAAPSNEMMTQGRPVAGRHKDGRTLPIEVALNPVPSPEGMRVSATVTDISERMRAERKLRTLASVFENSAEGIVITDGDRRIVNVNQAFTTLTGFAQEEVLGKTPDIFEAALYDDYHRDMETELADRGSWRGEYWGLRKDGTLFPEWLSISAVKDADGNIVHHVRAFSDISSLKRSQKELERLAHHDALTGLPNRVLLQERIVHALAQAERHHQRLALIFIDLDNFKHINDALGHPVGDQLLKQVTQILTNSVRKVDTVARIGGDEFLILTEGIPNQEGVATLAEKILAALDIPFALGGEQIRVTASMGICFYPEDGADYETLLRRADAAMYQAKEAGRNRYRYYTKGLTAQSSERLQLEYSLRQALELDQLDILYQPQVDLANGKLIGVEALARWSHLIRGPIEPARFIPLAEESGLIHTLEHWVMVTACAQAADWTRRGVRFGRMAINISGSRLQEGGIPEEVASILATTGCSPRTIEFEVAESFMMKRGSSVIDELQELRDMGVSLAIDDFGTGYSSLAYLKQLPIDKLKIDQSFVRDLANDNEDRQIVSTVIAMGMNLGLTVIAEGVETDQQAVFLRDKGCEQAQGFYFGKPVTAAQLERELAESKNSRKPKAKVVTLFSE